MSARLTFPRTLRGRLFTVADLDVVARVLAEQPQACRRDISLEVCRRLAWYQPNGRPKDRACRVVLLALHREGIIVLPPPRRPWQRRQQPLIARTPQAEPRPPLHATLTDLQPIELRLVSGCSAAPSADELLWNELVDRYHFLGYRPIVGPQLKLLIESQTGLVGCIGFGAAAWKVKPRDQWIGWTDAERRRNLHRIINNGRFLLPRGAYRADLMAKALRVAAGAPRDLR